MWFTCFYCTYLHLCSVWSSWNTPGRPVFRCLINAVDLTWIIEFNMQKKQRKESWWQQCRLNTRHMSGSGVKMAITAHHFQQVVLLINKSYKEAISCSASALPLVKRKLSLSHTEERSALWPHTSLPGRISVPNIWALSLLKACRLLSPCLICDCGWERLNRGRPPYRVRLRSLSIGVVSPGAEGISIEAVAQRKHREEEKKKEKEERSDRFFYLEVGLVCWRVEDCEQEGLPLSPYLGINHGFVWRYIISTFSQKMEGLLRV